MDREAGGVAQLGEHLPCKQGVRSSNVSQVSKGVRRMPWPYQPMKDAISCDKLR